MNKSKKNILIVVFFILISLSLRLFKITSRPPVVSHDEIYYVLQAKTIALTASDPSGLWKPWHLSPAHPLFAELPGLVMAPAAFIFANSPLLAARFTHALMGTFITLALAGIVFKFTKDKITATFTAILASLNPWFFQFSRMSFDSLNSLFFYLTGIYIALSFKGKKQLVSILFFVLGFYQYQGLKILFVPIITLLLFYKAWQKGFADSVLNSIKKHTKYLILLFITLAFFGVHVARLRGQAANERVGDLIFFDKSNITAQVNLQRQQSLDNIFSQKFSNKLTVINREFTKRYLASFDPQQLFVAVDARRNPFAVWSHGMFYALDALLIMIGFVYLWQKKSWRKTAFLITSMILISPIPSAINAKDTWIMFRSSFLFPWLVVLAALGFSKIWKNTKHWGKVALVGVYLLSVLQFGYQYFYRYPVYGTQGKYFSERLMSSYIKRVSNKSKVSVLTDEADFAYQNYLVFANKVNKESILEIQRTFRESKYELGSARFDTTCIDEDEIAAKTVIFADSSTAACAENNQDLPLADATLPSLLDSGSIFKIYNDHLCKKYDLGRVSNVRQDIFNIETLSDEAFCKNFFIHEK